MNVIIVVIITILVGALVTKHNLEMIFEDDFVEFIEYVHGNQYEIPRVYLRDIDNPLEAFNEAEFVKRFRFTKQTVVRCILPLLPEDPANKRGLPVPIVHKATIALRFYATNSFQV